MQSLEPLQRCKAVLRQKMGSLTPSSSSSPSSQAQESSTSRVPKWVPIFAFIGTSLALAIPLLMLRRQRSSAARIALKNSSAPPPRKSLQTTATLPVSSSASAAVEPSSSNINLLERPTDSETNTSLMSALSQMNASSAMLAAKAFGIATALVAVGSFGMIWTVKTTLGINDARQFGVRMRALLWTLAPSLTSRIHRPPETEEERHAVHEVAPFGVHEEWNWADAEKRLQRAYEEGGFPLWSKIALREVEAEARLERAKREQEVRERENEGKAGAM